MPKQVFFVDDQFLIIIHRLFVQGILHCVYLEGVSDLAKECKSQPGYDAVLATAADADLVITELMPTPPYHEFTQV